MGHDPAPRIEVAGEVVRVWSDGGLLDQAPDAFAIAFERPQFAAALERVERDLQAFLERVGRWAQVVGFADSEVLCRKLNGDFDIGSALGKKL